MTAPDLPPLTYLTIDSLAEGVGASQVVPYVERLAARGLTVTVHSFERGAPDPAVARRLAAGGVTWRPHAFRVGGAPGGLLRAAEGAAATRGAPLLHARGDIPAASALLGRAGAWLWDVRALWRQQRADQGMLRTRSLPDRAMAAVERAAGRRAGAVVTLAATAVPALSAQLGFDVSPKARVIPTCVDLERFSASPLPGGDEVRLLLAGTLNALYDVPGMIEVTNELARRRPCRLEVLSPERGPWHDQLASAGAVMGSVPPAAMPAQVAARHVGLSMLRPGGGNVAAVPTKIGEFLAAGRPVVVSAGLGDMDELLARFDCGVVVTGADLSAAVDQLERLLDDPGTSQRCRALAEAHFDLDRGVDVLLDAYRDAVNRT